MLTKKNKKAPFLLKVNHNINGVSLWVNGRWVVDASTFNKEGTISISNARLKIFKKNQDEIDNNVTLKFVPDKFDQRDISANKKREKKE